MITSQKHNAEVDIFKRTLGVLGEQLGGRISDEEAGTLLQGLGREIRDHNGDKSAEKYWGFAGS
ncbi:hypothetical protein FKW77_007057 [Venturia effusa]|uniref:Uncharacterized protein n=1 Tax=Venturia effusa TaxID=50376 RepID=A0A517L5N2_9PEZI|nr:hypothetical protein FKW77_007057 [Venturia effusa]